MQPHASHLAADAAAVAAAAAAVDVAAAAAAAVAVAAAAVAVAAAAAAEQRALVLQVRQQEQQWPAAAKEESSHWQRLGEGMREAGCGTVTRRITTYHTGGVAVAVLG